MATSVRLFIDYWNFELQWRDRCSGGRCDWTKLPNVLLSGAEACASQLGPLKLDDTRVYASTNPDRDGKLRAWFDTFLDRQPGFRVFVRERTSRRNPVHCRKCSTETAACPKCSAPFMRAAEKGVDAAILTDMFSLAWEEAYEVALLVSGDSDLIPAVEKIQDRGPRIINATWKNYGHELAKACWASFDIDPFVAQLTRSAVASGPAPTPTTKP